MPTAYPPGDDAHELDPLRPAEAASGQLRAPSPDDPPIAGPSRRPTSVPGREARDAESRRHGKSRAVYGRPSALSLRPGGSTERGIGRDFFLTDESATPTVEIPHDLHAFLQPLDHQNEAQGIRSSWKRSLYLLLESPSSSSSAFLIHAFSTSLIVLSALITTIETLPAFRGAEGTLWFGLETALVFCFTVEYAARVSAHSDSWSMLWRWMKTPFAILDLMAILPYYIEIALSADTSAIFRFSVLRTFRLLRVFQAFRYSNTIVLTIEVMVVSFKRSKDALVALAFFVVTSLMVFATILYFCERGTWDSEIEAFVTPDGDVSQFSSIPGAAWFVLVTMTTTGYGDMVPRTILGKLVAVPLLAFGLLLIALPSFVLGRQFAVVFDAMNVMGKVEPENSADHAHSNEEPGSLPVYSDDAPQHLSVQPRSPFVYSPTPTGAPMSMSASDSGMTTPGRDLSNHKLARNQEVLMDELVALRSEVEEGRKEVRALKGLLKELLCQNGIFH